MCSFIQGSFCSVRKWEILYQGDWITSDCASLIDAGEETREHAGANAPQTSPIQGADYANRVSVPTTSKERHDDVETGF
jgi:hypothetical protein